MWSLQFIVYDDDYKNEENDYSFYIFKNKNDCEKFTFKMCIDNFFDYLFEEDIFKKYFIVINDTEWKAKDEYNNDLSILEELNNSIHTEYIDKNFYWEIKQIQFTKVK